MDKGRMTRERVIAAAAPAFNRRGFTGTSLTDLMEATGLQKGGIYRHFAGKEELALAAFDYAAGVALRLRFDGVDVGSGAIERLKRFVANFARVRSPIPGGCPIWNTAADADDGNAALRDRAREVLRSWLDRLAAIIREGKDSGEIAGYVDPHELADLLVCSLEGALAASRLLDDDAPLATIEAHLQEFLDGCAVDRAGPSMPETDPTTAVRIRNPPDPDPAAARVGGPPPRHGLMEPSSG